MLLSHQIGLRKVDGCIYPTYRAACAALGLLSEDGEWDSVLQESAISATFTRLRVLFAQLLVCYDVSDPPKLWRKHWQLMQDDIPAKVSHAMGILNYYVNDPELQQYILYDLEIILLDFGRSVTEFCLLIPPQSLMQTLRNKLLIEERNYDCEAMRVDDMDSLPKLNADQKAVYDSVIHVCATNTQQLLFVYGQSDTEKTFQWKTIISALRSERSIVLAIASSGITSLLLAVGRTTHLRFKIPLDLMDESIFHAKKHSQLANLLVETSLIIWEKHPRTTSVVLRRWIAPSKIL